MSQINGVQDQYDSEMETRDDRKRSKKGKSKSRSGRHWDSKNFYI